MKTSVICMVWCTTLLALAWPASAASDDVTDAPDDVLHVHLHNGTHGHLNQDDELHDVHATLLHHNDTHSVLHINSSSAGLHRDFLVSSEVAAKIQPGVDPMNRSDTSHGEWSGIEHLVPKDGGWMSAPSNSSVPVENRQNLMEVTDQHHQSNSRLVTAIVGASAAVVLLAGVAVWVVRGRRRHDAALLGEEDEEFTVFSVVDHPYPGKKGDNYAPLN